MVDELRWFSRTVPTLLIYFLWQVDDYEAFSLVYWRLMLLQVLIMEVELAFAGLRILLEGLATCTARTIVFYRFSLEV